ncbi:MAG: 4-(cytidine 5'-diphospho)-2-C-methyl-D-erythritol kinase [Gammaproteobacteria bacterium]
MAVSDPWGLEWPAPAKINLFLHVVGRREDGFHLLQTLFQFVGLSDSLRFSPRADGAVHRAGGLPGLDESEDLVVRAALALKRETGFGGGVDIHLDKRIPAGGGLGGGSSDAATVLVVLDRLWDLGLGVERLAGIGLGLGADVPVFVRGHAAWAEGVGEQLQPVDPPEPWYLLVHPGGSVSTPAVFKDPKLTRDTPVKTIRALLSGAGVSGAGRNDLEPVARRLNPLVGDALDWLGRFTNARMSGSGACVFAAFDDEASARDLHARLPDTWRGWVVRGLNRSPLHSMLATGV